jgi:arylsulfatase A-like enzyme
MDLTMSILAATRTPVPAEVQLDGINLLPVLAGPAAPVERTLFWRIATPQRQQRAVRHGYWKLLVDGDDLLLFDLRGDLGERHDLASRRPDIVRRLLPLLAAWEKDVDAEAASRAAQGR